METFRALIADYGLADFAADIGVNENTAKQMRKRDSVAPEYWDAWVRGAERRGKDSVTYRSLARIAASRRVTKRTPLKPAEAASA